MTDAGFQEAGRLGPSGPIAVSAPPRRCWRCSSSSDRMWGGRVTALRCPSRPFELVPLGCSCGSWGQGRARWHSSESCELEAAGIPAVQLWSVCFCFFLRGSRWNPAAGVSQCRFSAVFFLVKRQHYISVVRCKASNTMLHFRDAGLVQSAAWSCASCFELLMLLAARFRERE